MDINSVKLIDKATASAGETLQSIADLPILQAMKNMWGIDWLMTMLGGVNIEKVMAKVNSFKKEYQGETDREIANRLIADKAIEAGKVGLITNIIPPIAAGLFGLELASIAKLQGEIIYEIAAVYDLDLQDPALRGEVVGIFGLTLGGNILKGGLNAVELIPGIGAIVGASSNAVIFYALGHTACEFYATKSKLIEEQQLGRETQDESDWRSAFFQSKIVDKALIHSILASYPDRPWSEIMPILRQISPSSVKTVAVNINNPEPLESLLAKISPEYARILLQRSYAIALWEDGSINQKEKSILDTIAQKFPQILGKYEMQFK